MSAGEVIGLLTYLSACGGLAYLLATHMGYWDD